MGCARHCGQIRRSSGPTEGEMERGSPLKLLTGNLTNAARTWPENKTFPPLQVARLGRVENSNVALASSAAAANRLGCNWPAKEVGKEGLVSPQKLVRSSWFGIFVFILWFNESAPNSPVRIFDAWHSVLPFSPFARPFPPPYFIFESLPSIGWPTDAIWQAGKTRRGAAISAPEWKR